MCKNGKEPFPDENRQTIAIDGETLYWRNKVASYMTSDNFSIMLMWSKWNNHHRLPFGGGWADGQPAWLMDAFFVLDGTDAAIRAQEMKERANH